MPSVERARELATRAVGMTRADQAEVVVTAESNALTRFASNRINQNVAEENLSVSVRAVIGTRVGVASTNRLDDSSLAACCEAAVSAARVAPADPAFPGLPAPRPFVMAEPAAPVSWFDAPARARAVKAIVETSASAGLIAAGKIEVSERVAAIANSLGVNVGMPVTEISATVLSMNESGSGWASHLGRDPEELDPAALGAQAARLALRSQGPIDVPAGEYQVVLAPEAVADILDFIGYAGFSAKAFSEGRSFMSNRLGARVVSDLITIVDNATSPHSLGLAFDYEGMPKQRVTLIDGGVAVGPVTDSYWAARLGTANTGHALPAPNQWGPMALDLEILPGDSTMDELIGGVEHGVYVTRFHYVNVEDPIPMTLTGMTRDGTFLIEDGKVTSPLKNLRFTQSAIEALASCSGVGEHRRFVSIEDGKVLVPGLRLDRFSFTGQTA